MAVVAEKKWRSANLPHQPHHQECDDWQSVHGVMVARWISRWIAGTSAKCGRISGKITVSASAIFMTRCFALIQSSRSCRFGACRVGKHDQRDRVKATSGRFVIGYLDDNRPAIAAYEIHSGFVAANCGVVF